MISSEDLAPRIAPVGTDRVFIFHCCRHAGNASVENDGFKKWVEQEKGNSSQEFSNLSVLMAVEPATLSYKFHTATCLSLVVHHIVKMRKIVRLENVMKNLVSTRQTQ